MSKRYKVIFKMAGNTVIKTKEFTTPEAVIYCLSQVLPNDTASVELKVSLENQEQKACYKVANEKFSSPEIAKLRAFLAQETREM